MRSNESRARPTSRRIASGDGWSVYDVVCTAGPHDRPFEEQHSRASIAIVVSGTFQYRTSAGRGLMTPGSVLLGNAGDSFTCGHEHGAGDRCVSFSFTPEFCHRFAGPAPARFHTPRIPPLRALSPLVAKASELLSRAGQIEIEDLGMQLFTQVAGFASGASRATAAADASSLARVTRVIRMIDNEPDAPHGMPSLARAARLSLFHFLRVFEAVTGTTPHQYLLRLRLRRAAVRLRIEPAKVLDIALDCGFGDVANFNRAFRAEFGVSPRGWRGPES
ncbi:MAG TPA: AraC family transcriptional regulator [Bryobacteraceae bacterium]|nr:AraC family transcriptional regulator [Bryobacteraceae bacterium]